MQLPRTSRRLVDDGLIARILVSCILTDVADEVRSKFWRPGIRKAPASKQWPRLRGGDRDVTRYGIEPLLSLQQAAAELDVNEAVIRKQIREGAVPAFKLAGRWKMRRSDLPSESAAGRRDRDR